jgi:hypothetical protein
MQIKATYHIADDKLDANLRTSKITRNEFKELVETLLANAADNISSAAILAEIEITD